MKPDLLSPVFAVREVADAILHAAQYPVREANVRKGVTFQHSPYTEAIAQRANSLDLLRRTMDR